MTYIQVTTAMSTSPTTPCPCAKPTTAAATTNATCWNIISVSRPPSSSHPTPTILLCLLPPSITLRLQFPTLTASRNRARKSTISNRLHHLLLQRRRPSRLQPHAPRQHARRRTPTPDARPGISAATVRCVSRWNAAAWYAGGVAVSAAWRTGWARGRVSA